MLRVKLFLSGIGTAAISFGCFYAILSVDNSTRDEAEENGIIGIVGIISAIIALACFIEMFSKKPRN